MSSNKQTLLLPLGAAVTLLAFFLPWVKATSLGVGLATLSGAKIGGAFWLIPVFVLITTLIWLLLAELKQSGKARPFVLFGVLTALLVLIVKLLEIALSDQPFYAQITMKVVKVHFKFGLYGTLLGLGVMLLGGVLMKKPTAVAEEVSDTSSI